MSRCIIDTLLASTKKVVAVLGSTERSHETFPLGLPDSQ